MLLDRDKSVIKNRFNKDKIFSSILIFKMQLLVFIQLILALNFQQYVKFLQFQLISTYFKSHFSLRNLTLVRLQKHHVDRNKATVDLALRFIWDRLGDVSRNVPVNIEVKYLNNLMQTRRNISLNKNKILMKTILKVYITLKA